MAEVIQRITASRLTPVGRGAVATIRVCGDLSKLNADFPVLPNVVRTLSVRDAPSALDSLFIAANGLFFSEQPVHKIAFGQWGRTESEDLVVCRTAEETIEIHCHGGEAAVQRVLGDLSAAGCHVIDWREQVLSVTDTLEAECLDVLSRTTTWRTTRLAMEQSNGLLRAAFNRLVELTSDSEAEFQSCLDNLLEWANFGLHLSKPWSVVLTGRPNVGKSSLINALLGYQRAIVFNEPGTTRDVVTGETAFDGWPVELADTAGIRDDAGELESAGIKLARQRLKTADLRLVIIDLNQLPTQDDEALLGEWPDALVVAHKCDLTNHWGDQLPRQSLRVSSVTGEGLAELQHQLVNRLIPCVPQPGTPLPITVRQIEILRELRCLHVMQERHVLLRQLVVSDAG